MTLFSMLLADAIEQWGRLHRSTLDQAQVETVRKVWATLRRNEAGQIEVGEFTAADGEQVLALFDSLTRSDTADVLNSVVSWAQTQSPPSGAAAKRPSPPDLFVDDAAAAAPQRRPTRPHDEGSADVGEAVGEPTDDGGAAVEGIDAVEVVDHPEPHLREADAKGEESQAEAAAPEDHSPPETDPSASNLFAALRAGTDGDRDLDQMTLELGDESLDDRGEREPVAGTVDSVEKTVPVDGPVDRATETSELVARALAEALGPDPIKVTKAPVRRPNQRSTDGEDDAAGDAGVEDDDAVGDDDDAVGDDDVEVGDAGDDDVAAGDAGVEDDDAVGDDVAAGGDGVEDDDAVGDDVAAGGDGVEHEDAVDPGAPEVGDFGAEDDDVVDHGAPEVGDFGVEDDDAVGNDNDVEVGDFGAEHDGADDLGAPEVGDFGAEDDDAIGDDGWAHDVGHDPVRTADQKTAGPDRRSDTERDETSSVEPKKSRETRTKTKFKSADNGGATSPALAGGGPNRSESDFAVPESAAPPRPPRKGLKKRSATESERVDRERARLTPDQSKVAAPTSGGLRGAATRSRRSHARSNFDSSHAAATTAASSTRFRVLIAILVLVALALGAVLVYLLLLA